MKMDNDDGNGAPPDSVAEIDQHNIGNNVRASWNLSTDNFHANCARYSAEEKEVMLACFRWCIDTRHPMAKADFARRIGCSDNLLYKLYNGIYKSAAGQPMGPSEELISNMREFLKLELERYEAGETQFVVTPTVKKICNACDLARESGTIVFVWGPSHVGKTWTLERYYTPRHNHARTTYVRMMAASGLGGMVRRIADKLGISDKSNTADLIQRIKNALHSGVLLILDECHLLAHTYRKGSFHVCMEVLREIHDETGCGMVLCWTILNDVKAASQKELQQLWRRGVHKVPLPMMPTKADIGAILEHNGLKFPEREMEVTVGKITEQPYEVIRQVAKNEALKAITERIRYGRKLANKAGQKLRWEHFIDAHLRIAKQAEQELEWS